MYGQDEIHPCENGCLQAGAPQRAFTVNCLMITVGSDKTSLAALAVLEPAVSAPFANQGRKTGMVSARSRHGHPLPPGSSESSKLALHSAPHMSPSHVHPASSSAFWQEGIFLLLLLFFGQHCQEALRWLCKTPLKSQRKA